MSELPKPAGSCRVVVQPIRWSWPSWLRPARWLQWLLVEYLKNTPKDDYLTKSHWHVHAIWQHRPGSTLAQVMAHSLTAPSHYLNQCGLIIVFYGIHLGAIYQEVPMNCIRLYPTQNLPYLTGRTIDLLCRLIRFKSVDVNLENVHSFNRFEGYLECINWWG